MDSQYARELTLRILTHLRNPYYCTMSMDFQNIMESHYARVYIVNPNTIQKLILFYDAYGFFKLVWILNMLESLDCEPNTPQKSIIFYDEYGFFKIVWILNVLESLHCESQHTSEIQNILR